MWKATLNTYSDSPELDKGGEDHVLGPDWVTTCLVPRRGILDEVILGVTVEYQESDGRGPIAVPLVASIADQFAY